MGLESGSTDQAKSGSCAKLHEGVSFPPTAALRMRADADVGRVCAVLSRFLGMQVLSVATLGTPRTCDLVNEGLRGEVRGRRIRKDSGPRLTGRLGTFVVFCAEGESQSARMEMTFLQ